MNRILKARIIECYGTQADFATAINTHEAIISRVIRGRHQLPGEKQTIWAEALHSEAENLFGDGKRDEHVR